MELENPSNFITKSTLVFALVLIFCSYSSSQQGIRFNTHVVSPSEDSIYKQQFKSYYLATLDTKTTSELLRDQSDFENLQLFAGNDRFEFDLHARDLRSPDFKLRIQDENGITELPRFPNSTYYGYTSIGNYDVRITADDQFFYAMIIQSHDAFYIEPARDIDSSAPPDLFVMYWESDNLNKMKDNSCGVRTNNPNNIAPEDKNSTQQEQYDSRDLCKILQIALADDYLMFDKYGSVSSVTNHNMAVINNVLTNYDAEFSTDFTFEIVEIFIATSAASDPWTTSTNSDVLLNDFTAWGPNGFIQIHDVASLWTDRNLDGSTIGLAWIGGLCSALRYNILQDFSSNASLLRVLQAHEIGHNFNAGHDAPNSGFIMAPANNNTNTWSPASLSTINAFVPSLSCLSPCGVPTNDNCTGARNLIVCPSSTCCGATTGNISGATQSIPAISCGGFTSTLVWDVWYKFTAACNTHTITVDPSSGMDAVVDLRSGACNGVNIACSDNGGGEGGNEVLTYSNFTPGNTYYIRIYDYTGAAIPPSTTTFTICVTSNTCTAVTMASQPANQTVCVGNTATFNLSVNGTSPYSYYWHKGIYPNGVLVQTTINSSSPNSSYTTPVLNASNNGNSYYCNITNCCYLNGVTSNAAIVTVNSIPAQPSTISGNTMPCLGNQNYSVTNVPGVTYSWSVSGGGTISGSGNSITINWTSLGTFIITVTPSNNCGTGPSRTLSVTVISLPGSVTVNGSGNFCNSALLTASGGSGGVIYWQGSTSNGTDLSMPSTSQTVTSSGTYYFRAYNNCGWGIQGSATVVLNTVINTNDNGTGSLRDMIECVLPGGIINFSLPSMSQIILTSGEIIITKDLTLLGSGTTNLTISGNNASRIFHITSGNSFVLKNLSLKDANAPAPNGGAIFVEGSLSLENILLQNNFENTTIHKGMTIASPGGLVNLSLNVEVKY